MIFITKMIPKEKNNKPTIIRSFSFVKELLNRMNMKPVLISKRSTRRIMIRWEAAMLPSELIRSVRNHSLRRKPVAINTNPDITGTVPLSGEPFFILCPLK